MAHRSTILRVGAIVFVVAALGYAARSLWTGTLRSTGSEKDAVNLVCAKCDQESTISSAEYKKLSRDPETGRIACPKCGEKTAQIAIARCPKCGRFMPQQPANAPLVCPFCKAPFFEDEEADAAPETPPAAPKLGS